MNYYDLNFLDYINNTKDIDMSLQYDFVSSYLNKDSSILDVGFGSGRDLIYFKDKGYKVKGIDNCLEFVNILKKKEFDVTFCDVLDYSSEDKFDLIWCCASLLHLSFEDINKAINNLKKCLKRDGVIYLSFKYGDYEGVIGERYFTFINENKLNKLNLDIIDYFISDSSVDKNLKWINIIGR